MNIVLLNIYVYLILKPYYLFKSGTIQICDAFMIIAFFLFFISNMKSEIKSINIKENKGYFIFLIFVVIINGIWYMICSDSRMLLCTAFYIYNFLIILLFDYLSTNKKFLINFRKILIFNLIIQLLLLLLGVGEYEYGYRYKGTFNDPNQFAFYCMISSFLIYVISNILEKRYDIKCKYNIISYIITLFLIINSSSTGMLGGFAIFAVGNIFIYFVRNNNFRKIKKSTIGFTLIILSAVSILIFLILFDYINISNILEKVENSNIFIRLNEKFNKVGNDNDSNLLYDRGYDKILKYPIYIFFGAGEGGFSRFEGCVENEIHATIPSLLFYYGIIPVSILLYWMYSKIKKIPKEMYLVFLALLIESFTLINQRQSLFWIFIVLCKYTLNERENNYEKN